MNLKNLKISIKLFVAPVIFIVSLVILGVVAYTGLKGTQTNMELLQKQSSERVMAALQFQNSLQSYNGNLFRLISHVTAGVEEEKLAEQRKNLTEAAKEFEPKIRAYIEAGNFSEEEVTKLSTLAGQVNEYMVSAIEVVDMTEIDASTAVIMMVGTDELFVTMYTSIDDLTVFWKEAGNVSFANAVENVDSTVLIFVIVSLLALLISIAVTVVMSRLITKPIQGMTVTMARLAEGDDSVEVEAQDQKDEIGEMARAVQIFKDNAIERKRLREEAQRAEEAQAARERREQEEKAQLEAEQRDRERAEAEAAEARSQRIEAMISAFETKMLKNLATVSTAATELNGTANKMSDTANDSTTLSQEVSAASDDASVNVQTVAAAAEELTSSITEISRQLQQANSVSEEAVEESKNTSNSVSELAETAQKISEVVNLISDIAGQTNLLALNATIEAARAGDAGKGFAVVASEVKNLATQTAKATEDIGTQINDMQNATNDAVSAIGQIDGVIRSIRESTVSISSAVEEQSAATEEISRNAQSASTGTNRVSTRIETVSQKAVETGVAANEVETASSELDRLASVLKVDIEDFLKDVRAA